MIAPSFRFPRSFPWFELSGRVGGGEEANKKKRRARCGIAIGVSVLGGGGSFMVYFLSHALSRLAAYDVVLATTQIAT